MKNGKVFYYLTEEGRRQSLLNGGDGKEEQCVLVELNKDNIHLFNIDSQGEATLYIGDCECLFPKYIINLDIGYMSGFSNIQKPYIREVKDLVQFDRVMESKELIDFEDKRVNKLKLLKEDLEKKLEPLHEKYLKEKAAYEERKTKEREEEYNKKRIYAEEMREKKIKENRAKKEWIENFGSNYLKKAYSLGFNCQRHYVTERAKKEFPEFIVDFDDNSNWNDRVCPTELAIEELYEMREKDESINADIVWLTSPGKNSVHEDEDTSKKEYYYAIDEDEDEDSFTECEAIIIRGYLMRYTLIKQL